MKAWFFGLVTAVSFLASGQAQQTPARGGLARELNDAFSSVYEKVAPGVVVIETRSDPGAAMGLPQGMGFPFQDPGGEKPHGPQGSGFLISADGYILTNNHVIEDAAENGITVKLKDDRKFPATLIGTDDKTDIAVLKIDAENLPALELGDSDTAKVGQFAFAIGAPFALPYTFTVGVISAKGRSNLLSREGYDEGFESYIQTDASINPGNSGGPLCDLDGRVVGVNTLINGVNRGLGFAVPINMARDVSKQLIASGRVARPWLGIMIAGLEEDEESRSLFPGVDKGVLVREIQEDTPAFSSELQAGDIIKKVDGVEVSLGKDLQREIRAKKIGQEVELELLRNGRLMNITVRTGELPGKVMRASMRAPQVPKAQRPDSSNPSPYGVEVEDLTRGVEAVVVSKVQPGSPAAVAGLRRGDVITELGGTPVRNRTEFYTALENVDVSRGAMVLINREGQRTFAILKP